jgi:hypothetical protein
MRFNRVTTAVLIGVACVATPVLAEDKAMSCETYLAETEGSRDRITGMFLWELLRPNADRLTRNQAGTMISMVPMMRMMIDASCVEGGVTASIALIAAGVIGPFYTAAIADPEIK